MQLLSTVKNEAVLSNVGEIGEFRIRNSAKAFSILSSGLYANKVRAIIRELSCNAIDSHTAAGKADTPFDVHLPNSLEPWFAIRDYGTGLSHEQVTNIYTTYFESTKTNSNDFIGALGLGSKSPFSYTDNFTVTAIQNGHKGIYTAFINEQGVPSIAKMMDEETSEPNGVEVKFAVDDRYDFDKFKQEAREVYTWFKQRPVITGASTFKFEDVEYIDRDIIPGVHTAKHMRGSMAVMGNIAYPIDVPQAESALGELSRLVRCGLVIEFNIGELDFQASREGLSYIPETVASIKSKLEALNAVLADKIAEEANKIENLWDRALFLADKKEQPLWQAAIAKYAIDTKLPTYDTKKYSPLAEFSLATSALARKYNIVIRGIQRNRGSKTVSNLKASTQYAPDRKRSKNGHYITWEAWTVRVEQHSHFIINDLKTGATERAKHHYRETNPDVYSRNVYILDAVDRAKPMMLDQFFDKIHNPPKDRRILASTLLKKEREGSGLGKNITILRLEERGSGGYYRGKEMVWRDAGDTSMFDANQTYYYVPLSGFQMQSSKGYTSGKELYDDVTALPGLFNGTIFGVRKSDIEAIKLQKNWVNFEEHIEKVLATKTNKALMSLVKGGLDNDDILKYNNRTVCELINATSPYAKLVKEFEGVEKFTGNRHCVDRLYRKFAPATVLSPDALIVKYQSELDSVNRRYPLLSKMSTYRIEAGDIAEYINLIDASKGI